ncbi:MAG: transglutaminase domain-containing protein, partial [Candidatus Aminicenantia bacterium]
MKRFLFMFLMLLIITHLFSQNPFAPLRSIRMPGPFPKGLVSDGENFWVSDWKKDMLYKISKDGKILKSIHSPGFNPGGLAWDGKYLWNSDFSERAIYQIDPENGIVLKTLNSPTPSPDALAWDGKYLWIADSRVDEIQKISPSDGTTLLNFKSPASDPTGLAFDGKYLWVTDRIRDTIYMISPKNGDVVMFFPSPGHYPVGITYHEGNLYVGDYQEGKIFILNIPSEKIVKTNQRYTDIIYTQEFKNIGPGDVEDFDVYIPIPETRDSQEIESVYFEPKPKEILTDKDGMKVAHFNFKALKPYSNIEIAMNVRAKIYEVYYFIFPEKVGNLEDIPKEIRERYTINDEKFDFENPIIRNALKEAVGDEKNPYWIVRKIFKYVGEKLFYELAGGWDTAPTVLKRGSGSCSEYTFVFMSLCRASGIPSRYVGAVVVRGDDASYDDVFHRWVEVYFPGYGWIPVDSQAGDKPTPSEQGFYFGHLTNRFLITTYSGGGSPYLEWTYNSNAKWTFKGRAKIISENYGEWKPVKKGK